ncbi:alpha/beta hydrolase [Cesiribacter andamanensis]|uniref:Endo-1,4-beta-xylanase Z n=1 Tax=Cesiribacter andamanensis AMV16 TaxID=1279009 RepID=M7MY36_9BACT|nr:alpha/beta hydrolase-fold protein [Cesiribacter andamanensis]EMR01348.1 Endo-1,4-beta-xylanase Z precursor [Cesiribacter andamanensis AMV16]
MHQLKHIFLCTIFIGLGASQAWSQKAEGGRFDRINYTAPSLADNVGGEEPTRSVSIYLPPGYEKSKMRYPVIYFLHGYGVNDSLMVVWLELKKVMDRAIAQQRIPPVLLVIPNCESRYFGSFYTNSVVNGNWGDFIAHDLVKHVDLNYRTIPRKEARGLFGHSMGGNGVLRIVMKYPDIYNAAYALSPGALHWSKEFNLDNAAFRTLQEVTNEAAILQHDEDPTINPSRFWTPLMAALGRSFSPDVNAQPLQAKLPVSYQGTERSIHVEVLELWEKNFPINMAHHHIDALKLLRGLKFDWGRQEEFPHIPATCRELSARLSALGIQHEAEEYIGGHVDNIGGTSGRITTEVLPFFAILLEFK